MLTDKGGPRVDGRDTDYEAIFAASTDGLVVNHPDTGIIEEVNPAFCRMHGYAREEMVGQHPGLFIYPDDIHLLPRYLEAIRAGIPFRVRARDIRKDGTIFFVEVHGTMFRYR